MSKMKMEIETAALGFPTSYKLKSSLPFDFPSAKRKARDLSIDFLNEYTSNS